MKDSILIMISLAVAALLVAAVIMFGGRKANIPAPNAKPVLSHVPFFPCTDGKCA